MNMVAMGSSMISGLLAVASIAYALSLEASILNMDLSTNSIIALLESD